MSNKNNEIANIGGLSGDQLFAEIAQTRTNTPLGDGGKTQLEAAAPDLLAALKFSQSVLVSGGLFERSEQIAYDIASAAIAKAEEPLNPPTNV